MKLRLELFVHSMDKSVEFYKNILGFEVLRDTHKNYVPVRKGDVVLGLGEMKNLPEKHPLKVADNSQKKGLGIEIVLEVEDISAFYNKVSSKEYPIESELTKRPWGLEDFRIMDPNGYYFRITSLPNA
jgi:lactoylglutathione lyase